MPRTSKWAGRDDLWRYCADLRRAGISYRKIYVRLSSAEARKRFRIEESPSADTIRYQLDKLNLLAYATPRSALLPEDHKSHCRGLVFLALALRRQIRLPKPPPYLHLDPVTETWRGFDTGPVSYPRSEGEEEIEVYEEWSSSIADPREISHFEFLVAHLESTPRGREIAKTVSTVFERVAELGNSVEVLWGSVYAAILDICTDDSDLPAIRRTAGAVYISLHPTDRHPSGRKSLLTKGITTAIVKAASEVLESHRDGAEHQVFLASWKSAVQSVERLKQTMAPGSLIRRLVQEGTCQICAFDSELTGRNPAAE